MAKEQYTSEYDLFHTEEAQSLNLKENRFGMPHVLHEDHPNEYPKWDPNSKK